MRLPDISAFAAITEKGLRGAASKTKILAAAGALALIAGQSGALAGTMTIYDSLYHPLPPNVPSMPFQAQQNSQFGDEIQFASGYRDLSTVVLTLSDWAVYSDYSSNPSYSAAGWQWPLTLTLYNVGAGNTLGSAIASRTINPTILWRPESDNCGGDPTAYKAADGSCNHGLAQNVTFDFTGTTVPDQVIYGLAFNTQTYGASPVGLSGPYNSLNVALDYVCTGACAASYGYYMSPSVGSQVAPHYLWFDNAGYDVTTGTKDVFSQNYYSDPYYYVPAIQFNAVPEPSSITILGAALLGLFGSAGYARRRTPAKA